MEKVLFNKCEKGLFNMLLVKDIKEKLFLVLLCVDLFVKKLKLNEIMFFVFVVKVCFIVELLKV